MMPMMRVASLALALTFSMSTASLAQMSLADLLDRHGVPIKGGRFDVAFDSYAVPTVPITPGAFATPLALMTGGAARERVDAAYAFGVLAGRTGRAASPEERAAAGRILVAMLSADDRASRIAGARVAGRVFAVPLEASGPRSPAPSGLVDGLFQLLNSEAEIDQLAAMDALGLLRDVSAVPSLTERYRYYRSENQRARAGGALEALARIGDPAAAALVRELSGDRWADGKDATALAVAFARERLLKDGSVAQIRAALDDKSRRDQARGYLAELGAPMP